MDRLHQLPDNIKTLFYPRPKCDPVPSNMIGTWFFDNPVGDNEQMAIFGDGRVVVLYSNGHRDETRYDEGFVELAEYGNVRLKMAVVEDNNLLQYAARDEGSGMGKRWKRIHQNPSRTAQFD